MSGLGRSLGVPFVGCEGEDLLMLAVLRTFVERIVGWGQCS